MYSIVQLINKNTVIFLDFIIFILHINLKNFKGDLFSHFQ